MNVSCASIATRWCSAIGSKRLQRTPLGHFQLFLKGLDGEALTVSRRHVAGVRKLMQNL